MIILSKIKEYLGKLWLMLYGLLLFFLFVPLIDCSQPTKGNEDQETEPKVELEWLHTEGNQIKNESGHVVVLHGVNRSGLEYDRSSGNQLNEAEMDVICNEWRAQIIRIPFNQEWATNYLSYLTKIDEVIAWIRKNKVYIILDLQWENTLVKIPKIPNEQAISMWRKLAERYKTDPAVIYDIHNEAHDIDFNSWRDRASQIIEAIQAVHPKALILVSGLNWASDVSEWARNPLNYDNIVYSVHVYPNWGGRNGWGSRFGDYTEIIPIFCGEFGGEDQDLEWGKELIRYLYERKIGWCAWSWVDWPHLTSPADHITPTAFGGLVKSYLERFALMDSIDNTIKNLAFSSIGSSKATVTWNTFWPADSKVLYGTSPSYSDSVYGAALLKNHTIKLDNLSPLTTYHLLAISTDELGIKITSSDTSFTTITQ